MREEKNVNLITLGKQKSYQAGLQIRSMLNHTPDHTPSGTLLKVSLILIYFLLLQ